MLETNPCVKCFSALEIVQKTEQVRSRLQRVSMTITLIYIGYRTKMRHSY